jgi:hypothetical protein
MKKLAVLMLTMLLAFGFGTAASAAMSIEIDFYGGTPGLAQGEWDTGDTIELFPKTGWVMVDIVAADVPVDDGVAIFSWILNFNPSLIAVSELEAGDNFGFEFVSDVDNKLGTVKLEGSTVTPEGGDNILGTFRIDCIGVGLDELLIAQMSANTNLLAKEGTDFSKLYDGVFANVNQVPIPAAAWLLGSGLLGLVAIRRKKKS